MKRVLILIHFAAKLTRDNMGPMGLKAASCVQANVENFAGIFSSDIAFGFAGVTNQDTSELLKTLFKAIGLKPGDNVSVVELAENISSTHPGLMEWQGATGFVASLARLARER